MNDTARWSDLGVQRLQEGRLDEAAGCFQQALHTGPTRLDVLNHLGHVGDLFKAHGLLDRAMACYQEVLRYKPDYAEAYGCLASVFAEQDRLEEAAASYTQAIGLKPDYAEAYLNLGAVFVALQRFDEAAAYCQQAIHLMPTCAEAWLYQGNALIGQGHFHDALASYQRAVELNPSSSEAQNNLGTAFEKLDRFEEAAACYERALRLKPDLAEGYNNLGAALAELGRFGDAVARYRQAVAQKPDFVPAHCNLSHLLLLQEQYDEGWHEYEWRWQQPGCPPRIFAVPPWSGEPLAGRTILIYAEQGLGDTIQFLRYLPLVQQQGARVLLECWRSLLPLAATSPGIDEIVPAGTPLPPFDVHAALVSLPRIFRTTTATIPADTPYIAVDPERVDRWRHELAGETRFKVGIVWQGNPGFPRDRRRSIPLAHFAALANLEGVALFSLQLAHGVEQLAQCAFSVTDLGSRFDPESLADLAAALVNMDLLISVDTAPAHLAGALGVPVWITLPLFHDWRWLLGRSDSPWYPTARLFCQKQPGDWTSVFADMGRALQERIAD